MASHLRASVHRGEESMGQGSSTGSGACTRSSPPPPLSVVLEAEAREEAGLSYKPQSPPLRDFLPSAGPCLPKSPQQHYIQCSAMRASREHFTFKSLSPFSYQYCKALVVLCSTITGKWMYCLSLFFSFQTMCCDSALALHQYSGLAFTCPIHMSDDIKFAL